MSGRPADISFSKSANDANRWPFREINCVRPYSIVASALKPSHLTSKMKSGSSNGKRSVRSGIGWNGKDIDMTRIAGDDVHFPSLRSQAFTAPPIRGHRSPGYSHPATLADHRLVSEDTTHQIDLSFEDSADSGFSPADYHRRQHERHLLHHRHSLRNRRISHFATNSESRFPCLEPAPSSFALRHQTALVFARYLLFLLNRRKCSGHRVTTLAILSPGNQVQQTRRASAN
jgi:hypothetical protein